MVFSHRQRWLCRYVSHTDGLRSKVAGVTEGVGDHRLVNEHEEGQVGQEVEQVQRGNVLQLQPDGHLLLQVDAAGLQLKQQLLSTDEAFLNACVALLLVLQEEQEKLLQELIIIVLDVNTTSNMENWLWTCSLNHLCVGIVCVLLREASDYHRLFLTLF